MRLAGSAACRDTVNKANTAMVISLGIFTLILLIEKRFDNSLRVSVGLEYIDENLFHTQFNVKGVFDISYCRPGAPPAGEC